MDMQDLNHGYTDSVPQATDRGLVIMTGPLDRILDGSKTLELRGTHRREPGWVALIRKGSGRIEGVARITGSIGPMGVDELRRRAAEHQVAPDEIEAVHAHGWVYGWQLQDVHRLAEPVAYVHRGMSQIRLADDEVQALRRQMLQARRVQPVRTSAPVGVALPRPVGVPPRIGPAPCGPALAPVATPALARPGAAGRPGLGPEEATRTLQSLGWTIRHETKKVRRMERGSQAVYVNLESKGGGAVLVVHPDLEARRPALERIAGVRSNPGFRHSSNLGLFPKRQHHGAAPIPHGIAFGFDGPQALHALIDAINQATAIRRL